MTYGERLENIFRLEREANSKQAHADALRAETEGLVRSGKLKIEALSSEGEGLHAWETMEEAGPHLAEASPPNSLPANARRLTELIQTRVIYYSQIKFAMVGLWRRRSTCIKAVCRAGLTVARKLSGCISRA